MSNKRVSDRTNSAATHAATQLVDKRVVTIGGGTGPFALLSTLKNYPCSITAIVTMSDSGGSSRRLMDEFGQLPFGDLRQALVALAGKGALWRDTFNFRFRSLEVPVMAGLEQADMDDSSCPAIRPRAGVGGHSLGNLIISALEVINEGNLLWALEDAQELLGTAGRVLPITLEHATLCAELVTGETICGESDIDLRGEKSDLPLPPIQHIFLREPVQACQEALHAIRRADVIILGPGDLYTSVLPNLLISDVAEAIRASSAQKVYICNLMTKHGETDGFCATDFVEELHQYLGGPVDRVIMHDGSLPAHLSGLYQAKKQYPVRPDAPAVRQLGVDVAVGNLLSIHGTHLVRHNPDKLIDAIFPSPRRYMTPSSAPGAQTDVPVLVRSSTAR